VIYKVIALRETAGVNLFQPIWLNHARDDTSQNKRLTHKWRHANDLNTAITQLIVPIDRPPMALFQGKPSTKEIYE